MVQLKITRERFEFVFPEDDIDMIWDTPRNLWLGRAGGFITNPQGSGSELNDLREVSVVLNEPEPESQRQLERPSTRPLATLSLQVFKVENYYFTEEKTPTDILPVSIGKKPIYSVMNNPCFTFVVGAGEEYELIRNPLDKSRAKLRLLPAGSQSQSGPRPEVKGTADPIKSNGPKTANKPASSMLQRRGDGIYVSSLYSAKLG